MSEIWELPSSTVVVFEGATTRPSLLYDINGEPLQYAPPKIKMGFDLTPKKDKDVRENQDQKNVSL